MSLNWLFATGFRNLIDTQLELKPGINLLFGENGSGKTSLLESAYFLSSARSFRTTLHDPLIQRGQDGCLVRGELERQGRTWRVGITRDRSGERQIRINDESCQKASELASLLPTLVLSPESLDMLLGPPEQRRRFLNWGLFHVEPGFTVRWEEANRALRQRNRILREGISTPTELNAWSIQLAGLAEGLDLARGLYIEQYRPVFLEVVSQLSGMSGVSLEYHRGWGEDTTLLEVYERDAESDKKRGFTQKGFQRADVRITINGQPAVKVCSRGELKALVWAMILAQGAVANQQEDRETLYLIDDLASEFDVDHRRRVGDYLAATGKQVLLTGVEKKALMASCDGKFERLFHVEQGRAKVREN
ncbi:MAG: DNA replication/repair protein RecF [Gammaproteobacteria bacterium]|jgi:DNA replication and repair protein RecF|nr:DNA replication/repair protein RecF [Gammaproteobacteria bacterium]MBT4494599.1 DNA replication/repair protein RecF [Gammaproteobacteria bacterium]MBT7370747.1 DNA replication/repair protein RecF [Gammaproteobacteria bacterium]